MLLLIGSLGPLGYLPASGTVTVALLGPPTYWVLHTLPTGFVLVMATLFALLSVWVHSVGDRILGEKDSRRLVWDEIAGFLFAVLGVTQFTWQLCVLAILVERLIDILKVPPANWIERHWPRGWGVVGDDVVAGLYTCAIVHGCVRWAPQWMGL